MCILWVSRCHSLTGYLIKVVFVSVLGFAEFSAELTLKVLFLESSFNMFIKIDVPKFNSTFIKNHQESENLERFGNTQK